MHLRALLNYAAVYRAFASIVGGTRSRTHFSDAFVRAKDGDRILDLGCGTADILSYLPDVEYIGLDSNPAYIENATQRWDVKGTFICAPVTQAAAQLGTAFDIVLAIGVIHHLNDEEASELFRVASLALRPGGRLVTLDGVYVEGQSPIARFFLSQDRGRFVRKMPEYERLSKKSFRKISSHVVNNLSAPMPYTHLIMECSN
jgi:cyclopropane fatty-acyl-phospholipid synthase-like methyltransferase